MPFRARAQAGTYPSTTPGQAERSLRRHADEVLCLLTEHGGREAALRLPDETSAYWTTEGMAVVDALLGGPHITSDPQFAAFNEELPRAANAIAKRWCRRPGRETPLCSPVPAAEGVVLLPQNCPLVGVCVYAAEW